MLLVLLSTLIGLSTSTDWIFGYGSLINKQSRDSTINTTSWHPVRIQGNPFEPSQGSVPLLSFLLLFAFPQLRKIFSVLLFLTVFFAKGPYQKNFLLLLLLFLIFFFLCILRLVSSVQFLTFFFAFCFFCFVSIV